MYLAVLYLPFSQLSCEVGNIISDLEMKAQTFREVAYVAQAAHTASQLAKSRFQPSLADAELMW